jgi:p-hydroxybenzoate 3-monooxygenase
LHRQGIDSVIIEQRSREAIESTVRAGVLEQGTVDLLNEAGLGERMRKEGLIHHGIELRFSKKSHRIDLSKLTGGHAITIYAQHEVIRDLVKARINTGRPLFFEVQDVSLHDIETSRPRFLFRSDNATREVVCDFVAGCDGYHGAARRSVPKNKLHLFEKIYPFGWLGILADVPPCSSELIYASHERGFALASQRNPMLSRYYVQCPLDDSIDDWPDERFWFELKARLPPATAAQVVTGPSIEKSIAPLRSFVAEPMRFGNLFLAGDAAHIVPPTGAKGLNLAISDVYYLSRALVQHYGDHDDHYLDRYSEMALRRVWGSVRFSWWLTKLLHRFPDQTEFDQRAQEIELDYLASSVHAQASVCEQYAGLPYED